MASSFDDVEPLLSRRDAAPLLEGFMRQSPGSSGTSDPRSNEVIEEDKASRSPTRREKVTIQRTLGISEAVGLCIGVIVGSGIFISPADVSRNAGSVGEALIIWSFCGIVSIIGSLSLAELGVIIPKSGGDYTYIYDIFGPFWGFIRLWSEAVIIRPCGHAIIALTCCYYLLQPFFSDDTKPPTLAVQMLGAACIAILSWLNCVSIKWSTRVQNVFTVAKVAALILIIVLGILQLYNGHVENFSRDVVFKDSVTDPGKISIAMYAGLWAFSGWNELTYVVGEIKNPSRNLPLSVTISVVTTTILYIAVNASYFTLLSTKDMEGQEAMALIFGRMVLGKYSFIISICVALSCFGGINGSLFTSGRFFYVAACNGQLPAMLAMISIHSTAPTPTIVATGIVSVMYIATNDVFALINFCNFVYFFAMGFTILGLVVVRVKNPEHKHSFKLPLVMPIFAITVCFANGFLSFIRAPKESGIGVGIVCTALPVYFLFVLRRMPAPVRQFLDRATVVIQCLTLSVAEE